MIYLKEFDSHSSYESEVNWGGVDFKIPNVSYCNDVNDVHFNPYNTVEFYVGEITGTTPETVRIYTDSSSIPIQVSEGNKWYTYVLPKDKGLYKIEGDSVKKVVVKADITKSGETIIPRSTIEASFKGSNTSNVTSMNSMFNMCSGLTSLVLSGWNTSKVTNMTYMFNSCSNLKSLDVSSFNTSNVTNMSSMFSSCNGLTSLTLSNFNTSNVTDTSYMFNGCSKLTSLDLSNFNTSKVTYMSHMFNGCEGLTSLVLSNFVTSNVTNMNGMFDGCSGLTSLDLSGWDTSKVVDMNSMFNGCSNLTSIKMVGCTPETRTKIEEALTAAGIINNVTIVTE